MDGYSDLLYARPSFAEGMARAFDLGTTLEEYNQSLSAEQADYLALRSDWNAVLADLHSAYEAAVQESVANGDLQPQQG